MHNRCAAESVTTPTGWQELVINLAALAAACLPARAAQAIAAVVTIGMMAAHAITQPNGLTRRITDGIATVASGARHGTLARRREMSDESAPAWPPNPARIATRRDFGAELSLLREEAGLTVRDVAQRIGVPASTLGGYFSGTHVPGLSAAHLFDELLSVCGVTDPQAVGEWHRALRRIRRRATGRAPTPTLLLPAASQAGLPDGADSAAPDQVTWPTSAATVSTRPPVERLIRQPRIRGRVALLHVLAASLDQPRPPGQTPDVHVLHGLGGCGKSTVALVLAQQSGQSNIRTWWIDASQPTVALASLRAVAVELGATSDQLALGSPPDQLWHLLAELRSPWLLVVDNADDAARVLALPGGCIMDGNGWLRPVSGPYGAVVVTTRDGSSETWGSGGQQWVRLHAVERLGVSDGGLMLRELAGEGAGPVRSAERLSERLGGLPLALRLAGQFLGQVAKMPAGLATANEVHSFHEYLAAIDEGRHQVLDQESDDDGHADRHNRELVSSTWELSLDLLESRGLPQARPLLRLLSCLRPSAVPYGLLLQPSVMAVCPLFAGITARQIWLTIEALADLGLVDVQHNTAIEDALVADTLVLHPLVRDTSRSHPDLQVALPAYLTLISALLTNAVRDLEPKSPEAWNQWQAVADHCAAPVDLIRQHAADLAETPPDVLEPGVHAVQYLRASGRLQRAEAECRGLIAVGRQVLGLEHPVVLALRHELSRVWYDRGQYNRAKREFHLILAARRRVLGPDHPDSLTTAHYLARAIFDHGQLDEAERYFTDVLQARRRILGDQHPDTLTSLNNVADVMLVRGRLSAAEHLLNQVRETRGYLLGDEHPATLVTRHHLATLLCLRGDLLLAEAQFRELDQVNIRQLGGEHPRTLRTRQSLADVLHELGLTDDAERLTREVLALRRRTLGYDHPATLVTRHRLGLIRLDLGDSQGAEAELSAVLAARLLVLGERHPATVRTRADLELPGVEREHEST